MEKSDKGHSTSSGGWIGVDVERKLPSALEGVQLSLTNEPLQMGKCPFCQRENITTVTEQRASFVSIFLLFLSLVLLGPYAFIIIPLISHFTANIHHMCPRCESHLGVSQTRLCSCFPKVHNDVVTVKIGSCATIISKKLLYSLTLLIGGIFALKGCVDYLQMTGLPDIPQGPLVPFTYSDWIADCGMLKYKTNPLRVTKLFTDKWEGKSIEWQGSFNKLEIGYFKKNTMLVDMSKFSQVESLKTAKLDRYMALIFDDALSPKVVNFDFGDSLKFKATILSQVTRHQPAVLYLHDVLQLDELQIASATSTTTAVVREKIDADEIQDDQLNA
eukprot:GHVH01006300.1.p1 GENE.GHVH01006300.1~~GHVH01006300.1.p1  ORF type:complete len:331 (-),score=28.32 GHVH01006300.1:25-1017(-)